MNQLNIFILSFGALQGVLLSALMLRKKTYRTAHLFLLIYLLVLLLQVVLKIVSKIWVMEHLPIVYSISYELPFLYGPLLFLFVKNASGRGKWSLQTDLWHFIPFLWFGMADIVKHTTDNVLTYRFFDASQANVFYYQLLSLAGYHLYSFRLLLRQTGKENYLLQEKIQWLRRYTLLSALVTFSIAIGIYLMYMVYPRYMEARFLFGTITIYIYWVSYEVMRRPGLFHFSQQAIAPIAYNGYQPPMPDASFKMEPPKKYNNSTLKAADIDAILVDLNKVMLQQQPFLSPDLNIDTLASLVGTNRHNLSQAINERLQKNFYDYLNEYRVKAARAVLANPGNDHLKIAAIAYDAGFNSLSTFNDVFKKLTGHTPSAFRSMAQNGALNFQA
jgi:AraC-like DNA-binding protein